MRHQQADQLLSEAIAHHQSGRYNLAAEAYRNVLKIDPDQPDALHLLGVLMHQLGREDEAHALVKRATSLKTDDPAMFNNLGEICRALGRAEEAVIALRSALVLRADYPQAHHNLGLALQSLGQSDEAIASIRRAIELKPDYAKAYSSLAVVLNGLGRNNEAIEAAGSSVRLNPRSPESLNNFGNVLRAANQLDEAIEAYQAAIALNPNHAAAHLNLGETMARQGEIDPAIASLRTALRIRPDYRLANQTLLFLLHYSERVSAQEIFDEHARFAERYERPLKPSNRRHENDRSLERRLRVGYVSPDFRKHPVGYFMRPIFAHHDPKSIELFAYSGVTQPDATTVFLRSHAHAWRDIATLSDEQLAEQVRADRIDILVDLTLHMAQSRLLAFARKPAPVQATYLGYPHSTGMTTIDYKLSDPYIDPEGLAERFHTERIARLPETFFCCEGEPDAGPVGELPAKQTGVITFASFNTLMKVTDSVVATWSKLLAEVENSRLMIVAGGLGGTRTQSRLRERFLHHGVDAARLDLRDQAGVEHGLALISQSDIALDTFPYGGGTTTCNCLWMGVPVVTLAGPSPIGRQGVSFLSNVRLPELIAQTPDEYISIARTLARDIGRLAGMRSGLRERMLRSPIMDGARFVQNLEQAYRSMWRRWCEGEVTT